MKKLVLLLIVICCGCEPRELSRQQTIEACKECTDGGFDAEIIYNGFTSAVRDVRCAPMRGDKPVIRDAEIHN